MLSTLASDERARLTAFNEKLRQQGCITLTSAARELGETLISKLRAIGLLDVSVVVNESGSDRLCHSARRIPQICKFAGGRRIRSRESFGCRPQLRDLKKFTYAWPNLGHRTIAHEIDSWRDRGTGAGNRAGLQVFGTTRRCGSFSSNDVIQHALTEAGHRSDRASSSESGNAMSAQVLDNLPSSPMAGFRGPEPTRSRFRKSDRGKLKKTDQDVLHVLRTRGILR